MGRVWFFRDVTAKKQEEKELLRKSQKTLDFQISLLDLTRAEYSSLKELFSIISTNTARTINKERVSIWLYEKNNKILCCKNQYIASSDSHKHGQTLDVNKYPIYFKALENNRIIVANEAQTHPYTKELSESYFKSSNIYSLIDSPIRHNGEVIGVFCCEAINEVNKWTSEEQNYIASVSDIISLHLESWEKKVTKETLEKSENKFRTLATVAKSAIFIIQGEHFVYMNKAGEEMVGMDFSKIKKLKFWDVVHPDFIPLIKERGLARQEGKDVPSRYEFKILNKQKGPLWFDYSTSIIEYNGKPAILGTGFDITERKKAEDALRDSEKRYQTLLDGAAGGVLVAETRSKKFIYCNPAICKMLNYSEEELLSLTIENIHPEEKMDSVLNEFDKLENNDNNIAYNVPCKTKNGDIIYANISSSKQVIDNKECSVGFFQDITDYQNTVKALEKSEQKYFDIVENANEAIFIIQDGQFRFYNDKSIKIINKSKEDIQKKSFLEFIHPDDRNMVADRHMRRLKGEKVENSYEFRIIDKFGEIKWMLINSVMISWEERPAILSFMTDISKRKKEEQALKIENNVNEALAELSKALLSPDLSLEAIAEKVMEYAKITTESSYGMVTIINTKNEDNIVLALSPSNNHNPNKSLIFNKKEGKYVGLLGYALNKKKPFYTNAPEKHHAGLKTNTDHFRMHNFLAVPAKLNEELVGEIALANKNGRYVEKDIAIVERLADLYVIAIARKENEDRIVEARRKAIQSDKLKTAFLENMSHEIRTPMNGIVGFAELLADPENNQEQTREYIQYIKNSSKVLLNLIGDIIDISKIESGQLKISNSNFDLIQLLQEIHSLFEEEKANLNKNMVSINLNVVNSFVDEYIITDPYRLRQILTNLIGNALKFTDNGYIDFGYTIENRKNILFYVKDTGIGIPKDKQRTIFERFRQVNETPTKNVGGTGLGLAISENLVKLLGGKIWLNSEEGKGSTFFFTIPYATKEEKHKNTSGIKKSTSPQWKNKTILVVEDEPTNKRLIEAILKGDNSYIIT
ncbi:MAG: hypothetical protein C0594_17755, partial [Marinilabiliales bacterium]